MAVCFMKLRDGRRLAYSELGDPGGMPIFHQHGMPGSRVEHVAEPELYRSLGVRVITPDRPGYGRSPPRLCVKRCVLACGATYRTFERSRGHGVLRSRTSRFRCSYGMVMRTR